MRFRQAVLKIDNKAYNLSPGRANSFDEIFVDFQMTSNPTPDPSPEWRGVSSLDTPKDAAPLQSGVGLSGERWSVFLHPKQDLTIQRLEIQFDLQLPADARFFANGFQSQSESRLYGLDEAIPRLHWLAKKRLGFYGDFFVPDIPRGRGYLHSWTYAAVHGARQTANGEKMLFLGSLNESTGFTLFFYDRPNGILTVRKDMEGLRLPHSFPALDFWIGQGGEQEVFERYFQLLEIQKNASSPALGWTSGGNVSEETILQNIENVTNSGLPFNCFQVGDGWQTAVGDWLSVKNSFPKGLGFLAQKIREKDLSPTLWLAPFVADEDSDLVRKNPSWLLKDGRGVPLKIGQFHALDFYNNEVRNYLGGVFHQIFDKWVFDFVTLDWLFVACLAPPPGKTRGQAMWESLDFLRKLAGQKKIIAAGVPLGSAFGLADFFQTGSSSNLVWENKWQSFLGFRERASAFGSLRSALGRWQLSGRAASVFSLGGENCKLSQMQQQTLLTVNALLGNLLFTSDDLGKYSPEQTAELEAALEWRGSRISAVFELEKDVFQLDFENDGEAYSAFCNLTSRTQTTEKENGRIELQPFETIILKRPLRP
jgi:alpha-galactosidase